jgi:hypothetical protein
MSGFWARYQERQRKLAAGVDADLVRDNRKHHRIGLALIGGGLGLILLVKYIPLPRVLERVIAIVSGAAFIGGFILLKFAQHEEYVINKPDPEKPPSILIKK